MRIFVALFLPDAVKRAVVEATERLRAAGDAVSWVKAENLHYTLRFMGELGEDGARRVGEAAAEAAARLAPFELAVQGFGCFPPRGAPRVLWAGAGRGAEALEALAQDLERTLRARGFARADHPFRAHLTVGRVRESRGAEAAALDWRERLAAAGLTAPPFRADALCVVKSTLSPQGSIYDVLRRAPIGG